ncbi:MAG TPA: phage tail protein [Cellvibrio sp.]|nr:phage tail protein [Cellvibrio sp.]
MSASANNTEGGLYPPSAFYFKVVFGSGSEGVDSSFQDVSGISSEMSTEDVSEGGENRFVHKLPTAIKQGNLELKRGIAPASSPLVTWCQEVMEGDFIAAIVPRTISVYLLNENAEPIRGWTFANAFPIKWEVEGFNSTKNEVAIEKIVFSYTYSNRVM